MGESNLDSSAIKRHICVSRNFFLKEQDRQWGCLELLGTGRGLRGCGMWELFSPGTGTGGRLGVNPVSGSAGKARHTVKQRTERFTGH